MNLGDEADSPWSDERSSSPQAANGQKPLSQTDSSASQPIPSVKPTVKSPGGRASRTTRKVAAPVTRLESVTTDNDPLGPLGSSAEPAPVEDDAPPELPQKEPPRHRSPRPSTAASQSPKTPGRSGAGYGDEFARPVSRSRIGPQPSDGAHSQQAASLSIERPAFHISVGDPHKVGDLTGSHTAYQVRTKTNSKAFRQPEFEVSRRYRDFLWLYNQLHSNNPGTVVPPPPEKQAVGRFEQDFVEARRSALERQLSKTAQHPVLQHDADFKIFLESESFQVDVKNRERKDSDMPVESKGMFGGLSIGVGNGATKFVEHDDWFLDRRIYLDTVETQLRSLLKSIDSAIAQRKSLSDASFEFSRSLDALSQVELSPGLTGPLASLADVHLRIRDLYARQAQQDALTLSNTIDEYIRLISSIKKAFNQREKSWQGWHTAESDLNKRRSALEKLHRQGRSQQDRIQTIQADVADAERRAHQARLTFEDLGRSMRGELERFEMEKVEDFRMGVETWLEGGVEAQKELIELWETCLMHLDTDEEQKAEEGDPDAVSTWARGPSKDHAQANTAEQIARTTHPSAAAQSGDGDASSDSQPSGKQTEATQTDHEATTAGDMTVKPHTNASAFAAAAADEERDV